MVLCRTGGGGERLPRRGEGGRWRRRGEGCASNGLPWSWSEPRGRNVLRNFLPNWSSNGRIIYGNLPLVPSIINIIYTNDKMRTILLLVFVFVITVGCFQDQDDNGSDLSQLRSKLRVCRFNLNESEEERDVCLEEKSKASAALKDCETRCSDTSAYQRTVQVSL